MSDDHDSPDRRFWQFTLRDLLVLMLVVSLLLTVVVLQPDTGRGPARRNACANNLKQLGMGLHHYHDKFQRLPRASSEPIFGIPGSSTGDNPAGYSWIVPILPYMEEQPLFDQWQKVSNGFQLPPFDSRNTAGGLHLSTTQNAALVCPSSAMESVDESQADYQAYGPPRGTLTPAISNYAALAGSHFTNSNGIGRLPTSGHEGNGLLVFPFDRPAKDIGFREAIDGTSKTLLLTESRELAYAAWCDGQATWVVGAWPSTPNIPSHNTADAGLGWEPGLLALNRLSLGIGSDKPGVEVYLPADRWSGTRPRRWGPSSDHSQGQTVNHLFADGHVRGLDPSIDKNLYLRLIDRADGGAVVLPDN